MANVVIGGNIVGTPEDTFGVTVELFNNNGNSMGLFGYAQVNIGADGSGVWVISLDLPPDKIEELKSARIRIRGPGGFRQYCVRFRSNPFKTLQQAIHLIADSVKKSRPSLLSPDFIGKFAWGGTYISSSGMLLSSSAFPLSETAEPFFMD